MRFRFRTKLMAVVMIAALALIALVVASSLIARRAEQQILSIQQRYLPKVALRPALEGQFEKLRRAFQDAVAASDTEMLAATRGLHEAFLRELAAAGDAIDAQQAAELKAGMEAYYTTAYDVSRRLLAGETGENLPDEMAAMQTKQAHAAQLLDKATAYDQAALTAAFKAAARAQETASRVRLLVSLACLVAVIVVSLWISRGVLRSVADLTAGFRRFGAGDFATPIPVATRDELGDVAQQANQMAQSLHRLDLLKGAQTGLAQVLRGELTPEQVADRALGFLAPWLGAPAAALYYADDEGALHLLGRYAGAEPVEPVRPGDGLVGQAALSSDILVVNAPLPDTMRFRTGLLEGTPRAVVFVPLLHLGRVTGILELALLQPSTEGTAELLLAVRDAIAIAIEVARGRARLAAQNLALVEARRGLEQKAEELASASAYKSQFLANMSHELRTPLNAIIGFAEIMCDGAVSPDSPQHKEFLGDILASGRHLLQLINDVLDLSKVEAGKLEFRPERVELRRIIGEVLAILRTTSASKRIAVESQVDAAVNDVVLDPARLKQVLYNFISNALKFTPEGGRVAVRAVPQREAAFRLEVEDTGIGIEAKDLDRLFLEFQQIQGRGMKRQGGTGLGLALTKRLVEAQGGSVGVRSIPGKGSVFYAVLPRQAAVASARVRPPAVAARTGGASVLVIEDTAADQGQLVDALVTGGYAVQVAATGAEALARCRERAYDAITLDLLLPDMSGLEVLQKIRSEGRNQKVPVVVVTVVAERGAVAGFAVHDVLPKPLDPQSLLAALRRSAIPPPDAGTVLVIDDDPGSLKLMSTTLTQLGYRASCAGDGESALRSTEAQLPSAIVLDLVMPGMTGFEFLERFRRDPAHRKVPVIVWTMKDLSNEEHASLRQSAQAVVAKGRGGSEAVLAELASYLRPPAGEA